MKNFLIVELILFFLLFSISCREEKNVELKPENYLQNFSKVKLQTFDLDTTSLSEIEGENGTKIWFRREAFKVRENQKIMMELKEFYHFEELVLNNINTITSQGELLESSGVIYLDFLADGKSLNLKKDERIGILFPENRLDGNNIYNGAIDTLNRFAWSEEETYVGVMEYDRFYGIDLLKIIPRDSLEFYYQDIIPETVPGQVESDFFNITGSIFLNRFKWINIDVLTSPDRLIDFELLPTDNNLENLSVYFHYSNLNSFVSDYRTIDNLKFKDIPIKNQTSLMVIGKANEKIYAATVNLTDVSASEIEINFKETNINKIIELLKK